MPRRRKRHLLLPPPLWASIDHTLSFLSWKQFVTVSITLAGDVKDLSSDVCIATKGWTPVPV